MKQSLKAMCVAVFGPVLYFLHRFIAAPIKGSPMETAKLTMVNEWDKVFAQSDKVTHKKVTFVNRYGITLAADMYVPKNAKGKLAAIAVSGPFGAVKEQASGLYAQTLAERGF